MTENYKKNHVTQKKKELMIVNSKMRKRMYQRMMTIMRMMKKKMKMKMKMKIMMKMRMKMRMKIKNKNQIYRNVSITIIVLNQFLIEDPVYIHRPVLVFSFDNDDIYVIITMISLVNEIIVNPTMLFETIGPITFLCYSLTAGVTPKDVLIRISLLSYLSNHW